MRATVQDDSGSSGFSDCPLDSLAVPPHLKDSIWKKANDLVQDEGAIVQAPGDESAWCIKSYSNKRPHYVRKSKCGGFLCDEQCLSFKSMKLCSHTVALAVKMDCTSKFVKWFQTMKRKPNFTALAESGKPATAGKKTARRGVSKKCAKAIRDIVTSAEDSEVEWVTRGAECEDDGTSKVTGPIELDDTSGSAGLDCTSGMDDSLGSSSQPSSASIVVSHARDVHSIRIGGVYTTVGSPPPLIPATSMYVHSPAQSSFSQPQTQEQPFVSTPFWLTFIFGNISRCNGCKGKISRDVNKKPLPPPDDIVLGHKEHVIFQNPNSGLFEQSREKRNVYYHPWFTCIAPHFQDFSSSHISISESIRMKLLPEHKECLEREFGITAWA